MTEDEKNNLIDKYLDGSCSEQEKAIVESWYLSLAESSKFSLSSEADEALKAGIWKQIDQRTQYKGRPLWAYICVAASVLMVFGVGYLMLPGTPGPKSKLAKQMETVDFSPGGNKAILLTANGDEIVLTDARNGVLATLGAIQVKKTSAGTLSYLGVGPENENSTPAGYNTLKTPKGGIYNITLADGTRVTLDAMSSIRFPSVFSGNIREVSTTGQVYFEVAHNPAKPFRVKTDKQTVEVLGTHFNVSTFSRQALTTTLLQGSVRVSANGKSKLLKPGEQSAVDLARNELSVTAGIDTTEAVAWKNGLFLFKNADVTVVMDQIGRWYDVDIVYEGQKPETHFSGKIYKNIEASKVLRVLSLSGLKFKIEGKKIIVMPSV